MVRRASELAFPVFQKSLWSTGQGRWWRRAALTASATVMMSMVFLSGCRSELTLPAERRKPAFIALPRVKRLAVLDLAGRGGASVSAAVRARVGDSSAFVLGDASALERALAASERDDDAAIAKHLGPAADAVLVGRVAALEVGRLVEQKTTLTKKIPGGGTKEVEAVRQLRSARVQVEVRVVCQDGRVVRGRAVARDYRAERVVDPAPNLMTAAPVEVPTDPIPDGAQIEEWLLRTAARDVADQVIPRSEPVVATWEDVSGEHSSDARACFARRDFEGAAANLAQDASKGSQLDPETHAAILYDLGTCEDLLGDLDRAEAHLDQALSLKSSELHLKSLRDVRRRMDDRVREGSP